MSDIWLIPAEHFGKGSGVVKCWYTGTSVYNGGEWYRHHFYDVTLRLGAVNISQDEFDELANDQGKVV